MWMILYALAAVAVLHSFHPFVQALEKKTMTWEVGEHVEATLSERGILTLSGSGRTRDYTENTAPFEGYADQIKSVKIKEGVTGIGDYLFYNCGSLKGHLVLPSSVIWIGDYAFSGEDREHAPKFSVVESQFTQGEIAYREDGGPNQTKPQESEPHKIATPGNAEAGVGNAGGETGNAEAESGSAGSEPGNSEAGPGNSEVLQETTGGEQRETTAGSPEMSGEGTAVGPSEKPEDSHLSEEMPSGGETTGKETIAGPGREQEGQEAGETEPTQENSTKTAPEYTDEEGKEAGQSGTYTIAAGNKSGFFKLILPDTEDSKTAGITDSAGKEETRESREMVEEPKSEAGSESGQGQNLGPGQGQNQGTGQNQDQETLPGASDDTTLPTSDGSLSETSEEASEDETEEYGEDGILANDLYEGAQDISSLTKEELAQCRLETVTSQITGMEIFYSGQKGAYECSEENVTFAEAAEQAGYWKADSYIEVDMEGIRESLPVLNGSFFAPELPEEIGEPEQGDDPFFAERFMGWMTESDLNNMGPEAPIYEPGTEIAVEEGTTLVKLFADWETVCTVEPEIEIRASENQVTYTAIDGNTGLLLPEDSHYQIHYQWQICRPMSVVDDDGSEVEGSIMTLEQPSADTSEGQEQLAADVSEAQPSMAGPGSQEQLSSDAQSGPGVSDEAVSGPTGDLMQSEISEPSAQEAGQLQAASDPNDENSWEDLEGETASTYVRISGKEDAASYFRVQVSIEKPTYYRSASEPTILVSAPVNGKSVLREIQIQYLPGDGAGGAAPVSDPVQDGFNLAPKPNTFTRNDPNDGKVFTGWSVSMSGVTAVRQDGTSVGEGEQITADTALTLTAQEVSSPSVTLIAQWSGATVIYVRSNGTDTNDGSSEALAVQTINRAYELLDDKGSVATNRILICDSYTFSGDGSYGTKPATITSTGGASTSTLTFTANSRTQFLSDITFENIKINYSQNGVFGSANGIYACGNTLTMGNGITCSGTVQVMGGFYQQGVSGDTNIIIRSGTYDTVAGGSWQGEVSGDTHITVYDGSINRLYAGSCISYGGVTINDSPINGSTHVQIYGGSITTVYGGNRHGTVRGNGHDYGSKIEILGGSVSVAGAGPHAGDRGQINKKGWLRVVNAVIRDHIQGGGFDCNDSTTRFPLMNGTQIEVINSQIAGNIYGGGDDGWNPKNKPSVNGPIDIFISGSTVKGNIYGGARLGPVQSDVSIHIADSTVNGVFGAGVGGGSGDGNVSGTVTIDIGGNSHIGTVYGGADAKGTVGGGSGLTIRNSEVGNVYAGGNGGSTTVKGTAAVTVQDGTHITGSLYGGGANGATVNTQVLVQGGTIDGDIFGGGNNIGTENAQVTVTGTPTLGGSIYGGSNSNGTTASSAVSVSSPIPKNVYGGGKGGSTTVTTAVVSIENGAEIAGNVFGGGESGPVTNATVNLNGGKATGVFGGGNNVGVSSATINSNAGSEAGNIYGGSNDKGSTDSSVITIAGKAANVFGGGQGVNTTVTGAVIAAVGNAEITQNLFGGGDSGKVTGGSQITLTSGKASAVFGGGNAVGVEGTVTVDVQKDFTVTNLYGGSNSSGTVTSPALTIKGTVTNVFGAGKGGPTVTISPTVSVETETAHVAELYGGGEKGQTQGGTTVTMGSKSHATHIYGGGQEANVDGTVKVTMEAGSEAAAVYGGSNSSGTVTSPVLNLSGTVANAYGGGKGGSTITKTPAITAGNGAVITYLYGGGEEGQTQNGANVVLESGSRVENVFGGGNAAGVTGAAAVETKTGSRAAYVYGGSNSSGMVEQVTVTVGGTVGGSGAAGTADGPGAVYGGGLGNGTRTKSAAVVIGSTGTVTGEVFGGGAEGLVGSSASEGGTSVSSDPAASVTVETSGKVTGNVYAGGDAAVVNGSTQLKAGEGAVIVGSLFGGGKGDTAKIEKDTRVIVFAQVTGNVFGGGALGAVGGSTHVDIAKGVVDGDGTATGNVFGGSDKAKVYGSTLVHVGKAALEGNGAILGSGTLDIAGTVFGGGNTTDNGNTFDASNPFVEGDTQVEIDATGYSSTAFRIGKSIFGDGNMCTVAGSRTITIRRYNPTGNIVNASIQRADHLVLETSKLELLGAVDSANLVPTIAYSMNRINDMVLKGGSTLRLQAPVNLVKSLSSQDMSGHPVLTTATDTAGVALSTENRIEIQQGIQMELRTSEDVTKAEYGTVSGYGLLAAYDKDGAPVESGIYVLGGYEADESKGGFLYGSGDDKNKKIIPTTDGSSWRIWAIGTDMKKTEVMTMSDRPIVGKVVQIESPWPADGSVYKLVENSVQISTTLTDGTEFVLDDPAVMADKPLSAANTTLGLTIATGGQGWSSPVTAGYIKGNSGKNGGKGSFGGLSEESMKTMNNRGIKPMIQIEMTTVSGINIDDIDKPLTVEFQLENQMKLSDGSYSKLGTLTVILQINREKIVTYDDILMSAGREYVRGTIVYSFDSKLGEAGATITKQSVVTLQYAKKRETDTKGARDHRLKFTVGDTPSTQGSSTTLPEGTTILLVDREGDYPVYAHYTVPSGGISEVLLSKFVKNGTSAKYERTFGVNDPENYLFVFDFAGAPDYSQRDLCVTFSSVLEGGEEDARPAKIVFSVAAAPDVYSLTVPDATGPDTEGTPYDREASIPVTLTVNVETHEGIDTTGQEKEMGVELRLKSREIGEEIAVPTDWEVTSEGEIYTAKGKGIIIPLASNMMQTTGRLNIQMKAGSLPPGKYQWQLHLLSAPMCDYPGSLSDTPQYLNFAITDRRYSIEAAYKDGAVSRLYPSETETARQPVELQVDMSASNGAATENVSQRASLWRKTEGGSYENIDFSELFTDASGLNQSRDWAERANWTYHLNQQLPPGTYRLRFELVENSGGAVRTLTSDTENFIVTP